ncbi:MAG: AraC family transcriptional regulator [Candidatus Limivivens sp.]|nr:AraC family transcriptional regulator [Candidatus Limivivens sp.]
MQDFLESIQHGTPFYPFQIYHMDIQPFTSIVNYHWHPELEILLIREGLLTVVDNQITLKGGPGDLFFIMPEHLHTMRATESPVKYEAFLFPLSFLSFSLFDDVQSRYLAPLIQKKLLFPAHLSGQTRLGELLEQVLEENRQCGPAYQLATKTLLLQVLCQMFRDGLFLPARDSEFSESQEHLKLLRSILSYLSENYRRSISLSEMAEQFHLSPKYFSRFFHQNFGKTFTEYLNDYRILQACELLSGTDDTVLSIALSCGFENVSYFIRRFKAAMGCTPGEYRASKQG